MSNLDEALFKLSKFTGEAVPDVQVAPVLFPMMDLDKSRYFTLRYTGDAGAADLMVTAPPGKVWLIHDLRVSWAMDSNVANRTCKLLKQFEQSEDNWTTIKHWIDATVAADETYVAELHRAASADPPAAVSSLLTQDMIVLAGPPLGRQFGGERLIARITANLQVGDDMIIQFLAEERYNFTL